MPKHARVAVAAIFAVVSLALALDHIPQTRVGTAISAALLVMVMYPLHRILDKESDKTFWIRGALFVPATVAVRELRELSPGSVLGYAVAAMALASLVAMGRQWKRSQ
jgi:hypothetical protein